MAAQVNVPGRRRRWVLIGYWIGIFVLTHYPGIERFGPPSLRRIPNADKIAHALVYAGWASIWWWVLSAGGRRVSTAAMNWLLLGGLAYAVFDEVSQGLVDRDPSLGDLGADLAGLLVAVTVLNARQRRRTGSRAGPTSRRG